MLRERVTGPKEHLGLCLSRNQSSGSEERGKSFLGTEEIACTKAQW